MKLTNKVIALAIVGSLTAVFADVTVDQQIQEIKNAPAQERVKLMNQFKVRLRTMNEADREKAIAQLKTQTMQKEGTQTTQQEGTQTMQQQQIRSMQSDSQMGQKNQVEQMNQLKAMRQFNSMGQPNPNNQNGGSGQNPVKIPMH